MGWIIFGCILAVLIGILCLDLTFTVHYSEAFLISVGVGPFKYGLLVTEEEKAKREAKKKQKEAKKKKPAPKKAEPGKKKKVKQPEKKPEKGPDIDLIYRQVEDKLKSIMGTKVVINQKDKNKGRIEIEYYSQEELERLIELMESLRV